jgi:hypothetical protein
MFVIESNRLGCVVSLIGTAVLVLLVWLLSGSAGP